MTKATAKVTNIRTVVVTVPTWNEALNVEPLVAALLGLNGEASPYAYEVLVADDDSPTAPGAWWRGSPSATRGSICSTAPRIAGAGARGATRSCARSTWGPTPSSRWTPTSPIRRDTFPR